MPTSVHFQPLHTFGWFAKNACVAKSGAPNADRLAARALSLPLHSQMTIDDASFAVEVLAAVIDG